MFFGNSRRLDAILANQAIILAEVRALTTQGTTIMSALDNLTAQVTSVASLEQSAVTMIQGLAQQIKGAANDPAAIQALADQLSASAAPLAAAIAANTPAAPAPATPAAPIS